AGAGCLIGCQIADAAPADTSPSADSAESCQMHSGGGHCCHGSKRSKARRDAETLRTPTPARSAPDISCCPLANRAADLARKVRVSAVPRAVANGVRSPTPDRAAPPTELHALKLQVRDRGSTHLRCCVFLI